MKHNHQGSALAWTMAILLGLSIFIVATMTLSLSYMKRAVAANTQKQAYLTAKSGAQTVAGEIAGETEAGKGILAALTEPQSSTSFPLFQNDAKMGDCQITVTRKDKQLTVTALATMNKAPQTKTDQPKSPENKAAENEVTATVVATLNQVVREYKQMQVYYGGPVFNNMITSVDYLRTVGETDVFVQNNVMITDAEDDVVFSRNLIATGEIMLNHIKDRTIHVHQMIVSRSNVTLGERAVVGVNPNKPDNDLCNKSPAIFSGIYTTGQVKIDGGVVYGDITAKSVILTNDARVEGDIHSAAEPQIGGGAKHIGKWKQITEVENLLPDDFFDQLPEETLKPESIPSSIPVLDESKAEKITNNSTTPGSYDWLDLGKDGITQYVVERDEEKDGVVGSFSTVIRNYDNEPVYVYVKSGATLLFREAVCQKLIDDQGKLRKIPNIYFILEPGAELWVNYDKRENGPNQQPDTAPEQYFYAFGKGKMLYNVTPNQRYMTSFYGANTNIYNQEYTFRLLNIEYIPIDQKNLPVIDGSQPPLDAKGEMEKWEITGYKRGEAT